MLVVAALGITIIAGLVKLFQGNYISTPLAISILWAMYNIIPPALVRATVPSALHAAPVVPMHVHDQLVAAHG